ncbi:MerR family transcriptional regulator [Pandoraea communis]|uniref:MerR family transcriptional regulator n=1 Tax=Pandoraea communis TaxID=2508297 RepID=A0A5E4WCW4_9BURK|nr:hypothetical protein [Pandoraea communis]VVE22917.1 MerR family transcriptional regulator [Pandoraea communis]
MPAAFPAASISQTNLSIFNCPTCFEVSRESTRLETLITLGFSRSDTWAPDELNQRYLENRVDGLHIGATPARLVLATV